MGTTAQKLQNIVNEKASQKTMTNYGLPSAEQIDDNTKFIDYPKYIFNGYMEALRNPDTLMTNLPKKTGTGASITLNDTANAPMRLTLDATETKQETTTGKNLWNFTNRITIHHCTENVISNNEIEVFGTNNVSGQYVQYRVPCKADTTYTLSRKLEIKSGTSTGLVGMIYIKPNNTYLSNLPSTRDSRTFTTPANAEYLDIVFYPQDTGTPTGTIDVLFSEIQLEENASATDFEPYTGGQASPNPDYPQDVHVISGHNTITISNSDNTQSQTADIDLSSKNLLDISYAKLGYSIDVSTGQVAPYNNNACGENYIKVKPSTKYTISSSKSIGFLRLSEYSSNKTHIQRTMGQSVYSYTITTTANTYYLRWSLNYNDAEITQSVLESLYLQLEEGQTATTYEPYTNLEYCKIGNYKDEFIKATNEQGLESGKWYIKKNIGKVVFTGASSENWALAITTANYTRFDILNIGIYNKADGNDKILALSNYFKGVSFDGRNVSNAIFNGGTNVDAIYINVPINYNILSVSDFKNWLSTHNTIVYYVLATPTYTQITGTLETQLENIYNKLLSYNSQTNITQTNNDLPFVINASAIENLVN